MPTTTTREQERVIVTPSGTKQADVVWASAERQRVMEKTGDPPTVAPNICVEGLSTSNTAAEMADIPTVVEDDRKAGAEEVWIVEQDGRIRFFADDELERSALAPGHPDRI